MTSPGRRLDEWAAARLTTYNRRAAAVAAVAVSGWVLTLPERPNAAASIAAVSWGFILGYLPAAWTLQVARARDTPPAPPEPAYTTFLALPVHTDLSDRGVEAWERLQVMIRDRAVADGLDPDDPATIVTALAALTSARSLMETMPLTPDGAVDLHIGAWKARLDTLPPPGRPATGVLRSEP